MANWQHVFPKEAITCAHGVVDKLHPNGHRGTDYGKAGVKTGSKIKAITDGTVVLSEWHTNLGNVTVVKLHTGDFWYSVHMQEPGPARGTKVVCGDVIGAVGNTGAYCFGAHLHTGISPELKGVYSGKVVDIVKYVDQHIAKASKPAAAPAPVAAPVEESVPAVSEEPAKVEAAPAPTAIAAPAKKPALKGTLQKGVKSEAVAYLQAFYGLKVSGKFGEQTHAATVKLQEENGLKADGIVGPLTWKLVK